MYQRFSLNKALLLIGLTFSGIGVSCASARVANPAAASARSSDCKHHYGHYEGKITIYHDKFEGRKTACGIRFKQREMTAAIKASLRRKLFSPSSGRSAHFCDDLYAVVTNVRTGEQFEIPVIDTGGMPDAVLDLSEKAASEMRLTSKDRIEFELCRN